MATITDPSSDSAAQRLEWNHPSDRGIAPSLLSFDALANHAIPDALFVHDQNGRFVEVNENACRSVGYSRAELLAMNVCDIEVDFDLKSAQEQWKLVEPGNRHSLFGHQQRKDGSTFPVEVHFGLLNYYGNRLYIGIVQDITEREKQRAALLDAKQRELDLVRETAQLAESLLQATRSRYSALVEAMAEGAVFHDANGAIVSANPAAEKILGLSLEQILGRTSTDPTWGAIHEDGTPYPGEEHPAMRSLKTGSPLRDQIMGIRRAGSPTRWISINAQPLFEPQSHKPIGVLASFADITEQKRMDDALRETANQFAAVFDNSALGIGISRLSDGHFLKVNDAFLKLFGYRESEVLGKTSVELGLTPDPARRAEMLEKLRDGKAITKWEAPFRNRSGELREMELSMKTVAVNHEPCLIAMVSDITERKHSEREIARLATTDMLTGLSNRSHFISQATQEIARANRFGLPVCVLMLDLDHFKAVNDEHGHQAGDRVLERLGQRLNGMKRDIDIVGRMGGEEFAILLPHTNVENAIAVAERIRKAVEDDRTSAEDGPDLHVTISIGGAVAESQATTLETLMQQADRCLYAAKYAGRNRVRFDPGPG